MDEDAFRRYVK